MRLGKIMRKSWLSAILSPGRMYTYWVDPPLLIFLFIVRETWGCVVVKVCLIWSWVLRSPLLLCPWATFPFSTSKADIWFSSAQLPQLTSQVFQNSGTEQRTVYWTPSNPNIWLNRKRFLLLDSILENRLLKISRITFSTHTALLIMDKFTLKAKKKRLCNKNTKSTWQNSTSGHDFALE